MKQISLENIKAHAEELKERYKSISTNDEYMSFADECADFLDYILGDSDEPSSEDDEPIEDNPNKLYWLIGDAFEIHVTKEQFERGVTINDIREQLADLSDEKLLYEIQRFGCGYNMEDFSNRDVLLETLLSLHSDGFWELGELPE